MTELTKNTTFSIHIYIYALDVIYISVMYIEIHSNIYTHMKK